MVEMMLVAAILQPDQLLFNNRLDRSFSGPKSKCVKGLKAPFFCPESGVKPQLYVDND